MGKFRDLTGLKFDRITVIRRDGSDSFGRAKWLCKCICGNITSVQSGNLITGTTKSCGCLLNKESVNFKNELNKKFGRLKTFELIKNKGKTFYKCKCDCGKECLVWSAHLRNGHTQSCGCYGIERAATVNKKLLTGQTGKKSRRYDFSITDEQRGKHRGDESKKWSKNILQKYKFTCQKCGVFGKKLHAHHLDSYAKNPDKRLNIDNGVCLCKNCHKEYHSTFGLIAKKEDYYKWIGEK